MSGWPVKLNRREALAGLAGCALCGGGARAQGATAAIDIHHHFLPPAYKQAAGDALARFATGAADVLAWTPARSLRAMDEAGIDRAMLSISAPGVSLGGGTDAAVLARGCNEFAARLAEEHPGRFGQFLALPMPDVAAAIAEVDHWLPNEAGGVALMSNYAGTYLGDPRFRPLFDRLDVLSAVVFIHPTTAPCCLGLVPDVATPLIEFPVDTARTVASLLWSGTLSRCRNIRFVLSHGGGAIPMLIERMSALGMIRPELATRVPEGAQAALGRLYVDTASITNPPALSAVERWLPHSQILFGTDFPWGNPARSRAALRTGLPSDLDQAAVLYGNAARLLGLRS